MPYRSAVDIWSSSLVRLSLTSTSARVVSTNNIYVLGISGICGLFLCLAQDGRPIRGGSRYSTLRPKSIAKSLCALMVVRVREMGCYLDYDTYRWP